MSFIVGLQYTATKFQLHLVLTMTKQEKPMVRLLKIPPPKAVTRNKLETCIVALGVVFRPSADGGSHGRFISEKDSTLFFCTCRPHPRSSIGAKPLQNSVARPPINRMI